MRLVAGDVGGTKTLLRCVEHDGSISRSERYESGRYATFDDLLSDFVRKIGGEVDAACFAVAGPVFESRAEVTNLGWVIETKALLAKFPIARVSLINDFYAVALGVPLLAESDLHPLQVGERERSSPIGILGAGTGLGQAIVTWVEGTHHVTPTEGGHGDFAPQDEEQTRLFLHLHRRLGHVSWERVLSGMGLTNIYEFLSGEEIDPAEVARRANGGDAMGQAAARIFVDIYGAEAGNLALRVLARGGIFLAGGVAAKNLSWLTDGRFVEAFRRKGRFRDLMARIPVDLITNEQVGLIGAIEGAKRAAHRLIA